MRPAEFDEEGNEVSAATPAANRHGVRYDVFLAFMIAAL